ncbi:hypothetical protein C8Q74DRAFT_1457858 [Fomes fomentarius]|nr:hypothetical protein C8Q74DRAFT_1457858 [Fomes fomentarius]
MFQVASRHAAVPEALNLSSAHYQHPVNPKLNIPRRLARPSFFEPSRDSIARLDPGLAGVPLEYIRKTLAANSHDMLTALSLLTIPSSLPCAHLPSSIDAPLRPTAQPPTVSSFPTHVFAILSSRSSSTTPTAASFADRASLPPPRPSRSSPPPHSAARRAAVTLPIVPLTVPSPETYTLLHAYLHTMRPDTLLASLLPSLASSLPQMSAASASAGSNQLVYVAQFSSNQLGRLAHALAGAAFQRGGTQGAMSGLMGHIKVINGLWQNVCALGVFDAELWGVMDVAWEVVLAAMTRVAENQA